MENNINMVMKELEKLGKEEIKRIYIKHGAREPLYGVTTGNLKPIAKKLKRNYELSLKLYETGNYDAMYLAGMIADPEQMTKADFEKWIQEAYCYGIADYVVSVTLAESPIAQKIADKWIESDKELYASAGWSCYCWLLGYQDDNQFEKEKLYNYLMEIEKNIHSSPNRVRYAMNNFIITVGISYKPLHEEAIEVAKKIGKVFVDMGDTSCKTPIATEAIQKAIEKQRIGFKRKNVRC